jgi:1,4-dihydroxy-2-naphthoyl-CoA synthase
VPFSSRLTDCAVVNSSTTHYAIGLVNEAVPLERLRERVCELADVLLEDSPEILKAAKDAFKSVTFCPLGVQPR